MGVHVSALFVARSTVDIQNIVSWETVKDGDVFRLTVKAGGLDSNVNYAGSIDFGTFEGEAIKAMLLQVAKALAARLDAPTPIIDEVHAMLYEGKDVHQAVNDLLTRNPRAEA